MIGTGTSEVARILSATVATVTAAVPSLNGYDAILPKIVAPAAMAFPPDEMNYHDSMSGDATMLYVLRIYVDRTQDGSDQSLLNDYISRNGPASVIAALEANPSLSGEVADAEVIQAANYGTWPIGQISYLGVELRIKALLR
jgi:hypothetical protein